MTTKAQAAAAEKAAAEDTGSDLPDFISGQYYDITLSRPVEFPPGTGLMMQPGQTHHMDGAYCPEIKDAISGAVAVSP